MDEKNIKTPHSNNDPCTSNSNLCNKNGYSNKNSADALDNEKNYKRKSKIEISPSKAQKLMKNNEDNGIQITVDTLNQQQSPDIYKLPFELLADTFDYLPLKDLCTVRQTSKLFHQIAGFCFQKNYSAIMRYLRNQKDIELNAFHQLIQAVKIQGDDILIKYHEYEYYLNRLSEFEQLKILNLSILDLANLKLDDMKEILGKIEYLTISSCKISKDFIGNIPSLFPNIKRLRMQRLQRECEWIDCKFQKLESFELTCGFNSVEIGPFLEMNPNIRKLAIDSNCLLNNGESLKAAKLSLEYLAIQTTSDDNIGEKLMLLRQLLNELYEMGSYQKLKLYVSFNRMENEFINLASFPALIKLYVHALTTHSNPINEDPYTKRFALSTFRSLEEIRVGYSYDINDIEAMAENLENLERIEFFHADVDDIIPLIKRAKKLRKIKVNQFIRTASRVKRTNEKIYWICTGPFNSNHPTSEEKKVINLSALNAERAKLPNAKMVTLYVNEEVYLATKWVMKETDLEFIQLKRFESFEWDRDFVA